MYGWQKDNSIYRVIDLRGYHALASQRFSVFPLTFHAMAWGRHKRWLGGSGERAGCVCKQEADASRCLVLQPRVRYRHRSVVRDTAFANAADPDRA